MTGIATERAFVKRSVEAEDLVFRQALLDLDAFENPSARALVLYLAVKSIISGTIEFQLEELLSNPVLHSIYGELRSKQALLLEESRRRKPRRMRDDDWWDEEWQPPQIAEFDEQLAADLEEMETSAVNPVIGTQSICFLSDQMRALNAVITDALARYEYNESQLIEYMLDVMGIRD